jgi:hypothetical protein
MNLSSIKVLNDSQENTFPYQSIEPATQYRIKHNPTQASGSAAHAISLNVLEAKIGGQPI